MQIKHLFYHYLCFMILSWIPPDLHSLSGLPNEKPIVVIIPSFNNSMWHEKNLNSVFSQKYENFRVIFIDDASSDGLADLVETHVKNCNQESRFTLIRNQQHRGSLANIYKAVWLCDPNEIIVQLDGDDWLAHDWVLARINQEYANPDVWMTYGQFIYYPCGSPGWSAQVPLEVIHTNSFREYRWVTSALRSFYAGLFQKIKRADLLYEGDFYPMAGDLAYMWPMLEMAGIHSRFIPDILYVYNIATPINDIKIDPNYQHKLGLSTRMKKKYNPIKTL